MLGGGGYFSHSLGMFGAYRGSNSGLAVYRVLGPTILQLGLSKTLPDTHSSSIYR